MFIPGMPLLLTPVPLGMVRRTEPVQQKPPTKNARKRVRRKAEAEAAQLRHMDTCDLEKKSIAMSYGAYLDRFKWF